MVDCSMFAKCQIRAFTVEICSFNSRGGELFSRK